MSSFRGGEILEKEERDEEDDDDRSRFVGVNCCGLLEGGWESCFQSYNADWILANGQCWLEHEQPTLCSIARARARFSLVRASP